MAEEQIKRLMTRSDIIADIDNTITPIYFPDKVLDKNRVSTYGWLTEVQAAGIEDTVNMEQTRASDYCPELSNNEIHVNQTAKIRGVGVQRAIPGTCYAILGILKNDIVTKGVRYSDTERRFLIDRRSTILYGGVNFSLDDDILVRAVRVGNRYLYTANYTMEHMVSGIMDSYLQVYEYTNGQGEELLGMVVKLSQCNHNISEQTVIDDVEFTYDGLYFPYSNKMSSFEVYYKPSPTDSEYIKAPMDNYLTTASPSSKCLYYNDDETGLLKIMNNPWLGLTTNSIVRVEILETLGADGNITLNTADRATFSMYQDAAYNYSGVYVYINILTDTTNGSDGDSLTDLKKRLIDAKVRRSNITTEHDILNYIDDADANIQIVKKRNDTEDRIYYMYTLMRDTDNSIAPTTTKPLILNGPKSADDPGDFDIYRPEVQRKVLKANAKFRLDVNGLAGQYEGVSIKDMDCVRRVPSNISETLIVDPTEVPVPSEDRFNVGDIVRIRRTTSNGLFTDKAYTIDTHKIGHIHTDTLLYSEASFCIKAKAIGKMTIHESKDDTSEVKAELASGSVLKVDMSTQTEDGWVYAYYLDVAGWCHSGDVKLDATETIVAGTKIIVHEDDSTDNFYHISVCNNSTDRYISTSGLFNGYVPRSVAQYSGDVEMYGERSYYLTCPYLVVVDDMDIANYYFNSVNTSAMLSSQSSNSYFPFQMIARSVHIFRDSHAEKNDDQYTFTIIGTMNTENDSILVDDDGNVIDDESVMCYLFFTVDGTISSYLPMKITGYNIDTREFTFSGTITTNDFITESGVLEVDGLFQVGTDEGWYTCDYKNASFTVYFMYKEGEDFADYATTDPIMTMLPNSRLRYSIDKGAQGVANKDTYIYEQPAIPADLTFLDVYTVNEVTRMVTSTRLLHASTDGQSAFTIPGDLAASTITSVATADRILVRGTDFNIESGVLTLIGFTLDLGSELTLTVDTPTTITVSPFSEDWFSLTNGGEPLTPNNNEIYTIITEGSLNGVSYRWDDTLNTYAEWDGSDGVVCQLTNTTVVTIDDDASTDDFYAVTYGDYSGYTPKADLDYSRIIATGGYVLMNSYFNNSNNLYNLILEYGKFTRSPVSVSNTGLTTYQVRAFGPIVGAPASDKHEEVPSQLSYALQIICDAADNTEALIDLQQAFGLTEDLAAYVLNNRIKMLEKGTVEQIRQDYSEYLDEDTHEIRTEYLIEAVPFFEALYGRDKIATLYDKFKKDADTYTALLKLTTDFEVALKYTATYGPSKYIEASGIRQDGGTESNVDLGELNPTMYFKIYGLGIDVAAVYEYIFEYMRDHYITDEIMFVSNICTAVENRFPEVESIKYMGIDGSTELNASYQQFTFITPDFNSTPMITRYVPEQLNVTDIQIELVETRL